MAEPRQVTAGDTWTWVRALSYYPASAGWVLTYYASKGSVAPKVIACTAEGDDHRATVVAASTGWDPGVYHWFARVKNEAGEAHTIATGVLTVLPDPSATVDRRSLEERILEVLEPAILASAGSLIVEYELDGAKAKLDQKEARKLRADCLTAVRAQQGGPIVRPILIRFGHV